MKPESLFIRNILQNNNWNLNLLLINSIDSVQMRPLMPFHGGSSSIILSRQDESRTSPMTPGGGTEMTSSDNQTDFDEKPHLAAQAGISRQQLINR